MIKNSIKKLNLLRLYKRDLIGNIILKRKGLNIIKFLKKIYNIKKKRKSVRRKNNNFFRILNIPRPIYRKRKTKYGKYFILRQQFRIFYGFLKVRTLQRIIKRGFKKKHALNYFIYLMESRLDVLLYRLNFVNSVRMARQIIVHGDILVNKRVVKNPNYNLRIKEILTFKDKYLLNYKRSMLNNIKKKFWLKAFIPAYIEFNLDIFIFKFSKFTIYDIPFFIQITPYTFLTIMNFYTKYFF